MGASELEQKLNQSAQKVVNIGKDFAQDVTGVIQQSEIQSQFSTADQARIQGGLVKDLNRQAELMQEEFKQQMEVLKKGKEK